MYILRRDVAISTNEGLLNHAIDWKRRCLRQNFAFGRDILEGALTIRGVCAHIGGAFEHRMFLNICGTFLGKER